jgi:hypothetical protein
MNQNYERNRNSRRTKKVEITKGGERRKRRKYYGRKKKDIGKGEKKEDNIRKNVLIMSTPRLYNSENHHPTNLTS